MPLMAIVRQDRAMATEVFVEVFAEIYREQQGDADAKNNLGFGLHNILKSSK